MPGFGEKVWDMGRPPTQHLGLRVFGLVALLTGLISRSMVAVVGTAPAIAAITLAALVLVGVGGFFVTLALFLGAYTASGESWTTTVWRIAQLLAAVLLLMFVFCNGQHRCGGPAPALSNRCGLPQARPSSGAIVPCRPRPAR